METREKYIKHKQIFLKIIVLVPWSPRFMTRAIIREKFCSLFKFSSRFITRAIMCFKSFLSSPDQYLCWVKNRGNDIMLFQSKKLLQLRQKNWREGRSLSRHIEGFWINISFPWRKYLAFYIFGLIIFKRLCWWRVDLYLLL